MVWERIVIIAAGGALGALSRYGVYTATMHWIGSSATGTFFVNISGALALGLLLGFMEGRWDPHHLVAPGLAIGFLGAYTTFSTLSLETIRLAESRSIALAGLNLVGTMVIGLLAGYAGLFVGRSA